MKIKKRGIEKKAEIETRKVIQAMIVLIVVVIVILAAASPAGGGVIQKIKTLLPDFYKTNYTPQEIVPCPDGSVQVGYIDMGNNILLNNQKINLYIGGKNNQQILGHFSWSDNYPMGSIGAFQKDTINMINVYDENIDALNRDIKYREFPSQDAIRLLNDAFIFNGSICKNYYSYNYIETAKSCSLKCEIFNGQCSKTDISGKIKYSRLNCPEGQFCYIDDVGDVLNSGNITIKDANFIYYTIGESGIPGKYSQKENLLKDILKSETLSATIPSNIKLRVFVSSTIPFCYIIDNEISESYLKKDFSAFDNLLYGSNSNLTLESKTWSYSGEKMLFFVAWIPGTSEKVITRWKLSSTGYLSSYNKDNIVKDSDFLPRLVNAQIGSEFFVFDVKRVFGSPERQIAVGEFRVVKDDIKTYHIYYLDDETLNYKPLDCNNGGWVRNYWNYAGSINKASQTLSATIDKQCKFYW